MKAEPKTAFQRISVKRLGSGQKESMKGVQMMNLKKIKNQKNWSKAFTLAEVLITLGVIGVVAAVTMPILIQKVEEHILISQLKQAYAILNTATRMVVANEGEFKDLDLGIQNSAEGALKVQKLYEPYLKILENCGANEGCFPTEYALDGKTLYADQPNARIYSKVRLQNGMSVLFWSGGIGCKYQDKYCAAIYVDINGDKKPNIAGKDYFSFIVNNTYIRPEGERGYVNTYNLICDKNSNSFLNGLTCTARVLEREKFDYSPW